MKIITGRHKGRNLVMPGGLRPTQAKVRKAVFDILGDIEGLSFLELFAGTGAVGFEAVSRGVSELTLVECNRACLAAIRKNIEALKLEDCYIYPLEAEKAIELFYKNKRKFNIVFLDPPYCKGSDAQTDSAAKKALQMLGAYDILAPYGLAVVQHFKSDKLPKESGEAALVKEAKYSDTLVSFYQKKG